MPVTLAETKKFAQTDLDVNVIDEFRKSSYLLDRMPWHPAVSPVGGGSTLTYGYTRLATQASAAFRAINSEYTPGEVTVSQHTVDLKPWGGSFEIDRVLARAARGAEVTLQMTQKIKAASAAFGDAVINGDSAVDANSFDGLNKAITGSTTEYLPLSAGVTSGFIDLTAIDSKAEALAFLEHVDAWLALLDGTPDFITGNPKLLAKFKLVAAWADQIDKSTDAFGRPVRMYNGIQLVDLGAKPGSSNPVCALASRDTDGAGSGSTITNLGDLYAGRFGMDGFHGVSTTSDVLVQTWLPDFSTAGAVKTGEVEMGPAAVALKATKAAGVLRNLKVQ